MAAQLPVDIVLAQLHQLADPFYAEGMRRFGIKGYNILGINIPHLRQIAKQHRQNHELALALWLTGIHEARLLACFIDDYTKVTPSQMEQWVSDFDSWDICDQCCGNLFDKTPYAFEKIYAWTLRPEEYVKRTGFALIATSAVHAKNRSDEDFFPFFELIVRDANDDRNFVKKAVNWALRQMGKRSVLLHQHAIATCEILLEQNTKSARWIANNALVELNNEKIKARIRGKER